MILLLSASFSASFLNEVLGFGEGLTGWLDDETEDGGVVGFGEGAAAFFPVLSEASDLMGPGLSSTFCFLLVEAARGSGLDEPTDVSSLGLVENARA